MQITLSLKIAFELGLKTDVVLTGIQNLYGGGTDDC